MGGGGGTWRGTGVSCGIDSLSAIYEYYDLMELEDYKVTHLVYFKVGQHAEGLGRYDRQEEEKHFQEGFANAKSFVDDIGLPMIVGVSNLAEILDSAFGYEPTYKTFTYRNLGSMLILQDYFDKYFIASSFASLLSFNPDLNTDIGYYDRWLMPLISTDQLRLYPANKAMDRVEKTELVAKQKESYDHLSVCWNGEHNCGYCRKCIRTLITLDVLDGLDHYQNVFDIPAYKARRKEYFAYAYIAAKKDKDIYFRNIFDHMRNKGMPMPPLKDLVYVGIKKVLTWRRPYFK